MQNNSEYVGTKRKRADFSPDDGSSTSFWNVCNAAYFHTVPVPKSRINMQIWVSVLIFICYGEFPTVWNKSTAPGKMGCIKKLYVFCSELNFPQIMVSHAIFFARKSLKTVTETSVKWYSSVPLNFCPTENPGPEESQSFHVKFSCFSDCSYILCLS